MCSNTQETRSTPLARLSRRLIWPVLLLVICIGFYWKLVLTDQYSWLDSPDLAYMEVPRFQYLATEVRHSRIPLWDPHLWCGQPMLGQINGSAYPVNWILGLMPFKNGKIQFPVLNWYFVLIHFQAALFCYLLCRDLRRSRAASAAAGLIFSLGGFLGDAGWAQLINGALWAPLVFLFLLRSLRGRNVLSSAALGGAFLGVSWLSGHHEVPIYMSTAAGLVWLISILRAGGQRWALARLAGIFFLFTALVSAFQVLPGYEYGKLAVRWAGTPEPLGWKDVIPYTVHEGFSSTPSSILGILTPGLWVHVNPFLGVAGCCLAAVGVLACWRRQRIVLFFAALAAGGLLFAMASTNIFHGLLYSVLPVFGKARAPARAIALFTFAAAPLAAYGFDALLARRGRVHLGKLVVAALTLASAITLISLATSSVKPFDPASNLMFTALSAFLAAAVFAAWRHRAMDRTAFTACLLLLILFETGKVNTSNLPNRTAPNSPGALARLSQHDDIAAFLRGQPQPVRVEINAESIPYNFGDWHGINTTGGYVAGLTANLYRRGIHQPRLQDLLGVNFAVDKQPRRPDQILVSGSNSGLNIYRNPNAFPRTWIVSEVAVLAGEDELQRALEDPAWNLRTRAPIIAPAPADLERCPEPGDARILSMRTTSVAIQANARCRSMVVLADTYFPGWQAKVDGRPFPIYQVYGAMRGVVVDAGDHRIDFDYRPLPVLAGGLLTLLGLAGAVLLVLRDRRRRA
ncbi:MAG: YfhO family protein [Bryobacteraceae bacterium]